MNTLDAPHYTTIGVIAALWGVGGFLLLLLFAIYRLTPIALQAFEGTLYWYQWLLLFANGLFMAYSEGYRGFQKGYSPRLVARAQSLLHDTTFINRIFAPLFCMGYFSAEKRRVVSTWLLTLMIVVLIIVFHQLPQPWRGLLDAGVVVGLSWGAVATLLCAVSGGLMVRK